MVKEALMKIQQAEEDARLLAQKAGETIAAQLAHSRKLAEEIVEKAENESRAQAKLLLAQARKESEKLVAEMRENAGREKEKLRAKAQQRMNQAILLIKERFVARWQ
jgi:vacuolar-type H+-ATPase subunit H